MRTNQYTETDSGTQRTWLTLLASVVLFLILGGALLKWSAGSRIHEAQVTQGQDEASSTLRQFTYDNLQEEVVDISRKQPVIIEFYSSH